MTRAGDTGTGESSGESSEISADLKTLRQNGFGVFAVNTGTTPYGDWRTANSTKAAADAHDYSNYMFNQAVQWPKKDAESTDPAETGSWSYSPIKYWPNPTFGENNAMKPQYVSFFAYSPYVSNLSKYNSSNSSNPGILGYSYAANGDPLIAFNAVNTDVDLLFGAGGGTQNGSYCNDEAGTNSNTGKSYDSSPFTVNSDIAKMKNNGLLKFNFKHALSKVKITVDTHIGETAATVDKNSKVMIDYIILSMGNAESGENVPTVSFLDLATGQFAADASTGSEGKNDIVNAVKTKGKTDEENPIMEGLPTPDAKKDMNTNIGSVEDDVITAAAKADDSGSSTSPAKPHTRGEGDTGSSWDDLPSVTGTPQDIVEGGCNYMFFPTFTPKIEVYVKYHIYTKDPIYESGYVDVVQISKAELTFTKDLESGNAYTLQLHLGLTSVKMDATVSEWTDASTDVDLPKNVE